MWEGGASKGTDHTEWEAYIVYHAIKDTKDEYHDIHVLEPYSVNMGCRAQIDAREHGETWDLHNGDHRPGSS